MIAPPVIGADFAPLAEVLQVASPDKLQAAIDRAKALDRAELVQGFRQAFDCRKRVLAFAFAEGLIAAGIPPAFWHHQIPDGLGLTPRTCFYTASPLSNPHGFKPAGFLLYTLDTSLP